MQTAFATALLYIACFGFYQSNAKRASFKLLQGSSPLRAAVLMLSWAATGASLFIFASMLGWERGIPAWLGVFTFTGALSLLASALAPKQYPLTGAAALAIVVSSGLGIYAEGFT